MGFGNDGKWGYFYFYSFVPGPCILSVVNTAHIEVSGLNIKLACHLYRVLSPYWCLGCAFSRAIPVPASRWCGRLCD